MEVPSCIGGESEMSQTDFCILAPSSAEDASDMPSDVPSNSPSSLPSIVPTINTANGPEIVFVANNKELTVLLQVCEADW